MADGISFDLVTKPFNDAMVEIRLTKDRATMYALRETGRRLVAGAKSRAPVYSGTDERVVPGMLRDSIANSRKIERDGESFGLHVGPFGSVTRAKGHGARGVQLYRSKEEARTGFMRSSFASADLAHVYEAALAEGFGRYH